MDALERKIDSKSSISTNERFVTKITHMKRGARVFVFLRPLISPGCAQNTLGREVGKRVFDGLLGLENLPMHLPLIVIPDLAAGSWKYRPDR